MHYKREFDNQNFLIKTTIEYNNKLCKLNIETRSSNHDNKIKPYQRYVSYCNRKQKTNRQLNNSYKIVLIEPDLFQQCKKTNIKKKKRNNKTCCIYGKINYFTKYCCSNNMEK